MVTLLKPLRQSDVQAVVEIALHHYGWPVEFAPEIDMTDSCEWADGKSPIIKWEEGPDGFGYEFTQNAQARAHLDMLGYYMEGATSWAIVIYPKSGVVDPKPPVGWCDHLNHPVEEHPQRPTCVRFFTDPTTEV